MDFRRADFIVASSLSNKPRAKSYKGSVYSFSHFQAQNRAACLDRNLGQNPPKTPLPKEIPQFPHPTVGRSKPRPARVCSRIPQSHKFPLHTRRLYDSKRTFRSVEVSMRAQTSARVLSISVGYVGHIPLYIIFLKNIYTYQALNGLQTLSHKVSHNLSHIFICGIPRCTPNPHQNTLDARCRG